MVRTMFTSRRPLPPPVGTAPSPVVTVASSSPSQSVSEEGPGVWRGHCSGCEAGSDPGEDDAAWRWVDAHLCGIETVRPRLDALA